METKVNKKGLFCNNLKVRLQNKNLTKQQIVLNKHIFQLFYTSIFFMPKKVMLILTNNNIFVS